MGERGPLPVPHARRRNKKPDPGRPVPVGKPNPPRILKGEALAEWKRIVPELERAGLLTLLDRALLTRYCVAWAQWREVQGVLTEQAAVIVVEKASGGSAQVRNPLWMVRNDLEQTLSDLQKALMLTPNSRLRAGLKHEERPAEESEGRVTAIQEYRKALEG